MDEWRKQNIYFWSYLHWNQCLSHILRRKYISNVFEVILVIYHCNKHAIKVIVTEKTTRSIQSISCGVRFMLWVVPTVDNGNRESLRLWVEEYIPKIAKLKTPCRFSLVSAMSVCWMLYVCIFAVPSRWHLIEVSHFPKPVTWSLPKPLIGKNTRSQMTFLILCFCVS